MGATPPVLYDVGQFTGTTSDNFTIRVPSGAAGDYASWIIANAAKFNNGGGNITIVEY